MSGDEAEGHSALAEPDVAPVPEPRPWVASARARAGAGAGLFALAVALPLFRQRGVHSWATIWAEDGEIYSTQAIESGPSVLFHSYAGYLMLPPRLLAVVVPLVPVEQLSRHLALSSVIFAALLAWFVYWATERWISSTPVRLASASLVVLMPALGFENTANITNTVWVYGAIVPWALLSTRHRPRDVAICSTVAFIGACATALSVMYAPLALAFALIRRERATTITSGAFFVGLAIQGLVIVTAGQDRGTLERLPNDFGDLLYVLSSRVFGVFLLGLEGATDLWESSPAAVTFGAAAVAVALFAVLFVGAGRQAQVLSLVLAAYAMISFVLPVWGRGTEGITSVGLAPGSTGVRYTVMPVFLLASAFAVLIAPMGAARERWVSRIARPVFVAQIALVAVLGFFVTNPRSTGPSWAETVDLAYREQCIDAPADTEAEVPVLPPGWYLQVPCGRLR